jgi:predicted molibdopterin-dependent oxidoreductase YjgC
VGIKVVQSLELGSLEPFADAFLPAASYVEKEGHFTTWEGRGQRLRPLRPAPGIALPDWEMFASLALACGGDLGFETLEELQEELGALVEPRESVPDVAEAAPPPPLEEGLRLLTYPLLVDEGRLSERADGLKAALEEPAFVELHPEDAAAAGLTHGSRAVVRTVAGEGELPVRVSEGLARGTAFVPFNQPGFAANTLLSGTFVTAATVESVEAGAAESAEAQAQEVGA